MPVYIVLLKLLVAQPYGKSLLLQQVTALAQSHNIQVFSNAMNCTVFRS